MKLLKYSQLALICLVSQATAAALPTDLPLYKQTEQFTTDNKILFVDIRQLSNSYSSHLIFDHLETAQSLLSKQISLHFQQLIQVTVEQPLDLNDAFFVDTQLLKGQLQGAVGSFIEDSLPSLWNKHALVIENANLAKYIEQITSGICPINENGFTTNTCIQDHAQQLTAQVDQYIQSHLINIVNLIVKVDLPPLFETTQNHVNGILNHFNRYIQQHNTHIVNSNSTTTAAVAGATEAASSIVVQQNLENSLGLLQSLETIAFNLYHPHSSLFQFTLLSRVE